MPLYATIVDGEITAKTTGAIPSSTLTTLYYDLTGISPEPSVGWYFSEICQTFSATAPTTPDGEIAPPYTPGGTPPDPDDFPPDNPGDLPPAFVIPQLIVFHGDREAEISVPSCPAASTELDATEEKLRTAYDLTEASAIRMQCHVLSEVDGAKLTLKYSLNGGTTWANVSAGGTGPFVEVGTAGDQRGDYLNVAAAAKGDVLLSPFVSGGDGATTLELGNVSALVYVKTEEGGEEEIEEEIGCALEAGDSAESFIGTGGALTTIAGWITDRAWLPSSGGIGDGIVGEWFGSTTDDLTQTYLDEADQFAGNPTMAGVYDAAGALAGTAQGAGTVGYFDRDAGGAGDSTIKLVVKIPADFDITGLSGAGWTSAQDGLQLLWVELTTASSASGRIDAWLVIREGRLELVLDRPAVSPTAFDLGAATLVATGDYVQILLRTEVLSDTSVRFSVYVDPSCPSSPTLLQTETYTVPSYTGRGLDFVYTMYAQMDASNISPSPRTIRTAQIGMSYTAADYGL